MKAISVSLLLLAAATAQAAVDPGLLALVMPEATMVAGLQVEQSQASPFGRYLLSQMKLSQMNDGSQRDQLVLLTGFDPTRDLRELVAAASANQKGVLIGRGIFQPGRITSLALQGGGEVSNYRGIDVIRGKGAQGAALAFLDASTIAAGDPDSVRAVIDRRASSAAYSGDLAQRARDAASVNDAWVVTNAPLSALAANRLSAGPQARFLESVQQFSGGVKFGSASVTLNGAARMLTPQDAQALADVLRFLTGMAAGKDPKAAELASAAKFAAEGAVTRISLELPEEQVEKMIAPQPRQQPRRR